MHPFIAISEQSQPLLTIPHSLSGHPLLLAQFSLNIPHCIVRATKEKNQNTYSFRPQQYLLTVLSISQFIQLQDTRQVFLVQRNVETSLEQGGSH